VLDDLGQNVAKFIKGRVFGIFIPTADLNAVLRLFLEIAGHIVDNHAPRQIATQQR
jgi:hypothetical protein